MAITVKPDPLTAGEAATVCVLGSSHAGENITVDVDDGEGGTASLGITLDEKGAGCTEWTVPEWNLANFNYSTCSQITRLIEPA